MQPKISLCAPVYNKEAWITEAVISLRDQSLKEIEIVFLDDGSTDGTADIIRHWQKEDDRIKLFSNKRNLGLGISWNKVHGLAKSEIICVASGDDVWAKERANLTYKFFNAHKNKDAFYGSFYFCDAMMTPVEYKPAVPFNKKKLLTPRKDGFSSQYIPHFVLAYRKKITLKHQYDEKRKHGVDMPFICDLALAGRRFGWTTKTLGYARILPSSVSFKHRKEIVEQDRKYEKENMK